MVPSARPVLRNGCKLQRRPLRSQRCGRPRRPNETEIGAVLLSGEI